jgi:hypothetical protein
MTLIVNTYIKPYLLVTKQNLHEDDEFQGNACSNAVGEIQKAVGNFYKDNSDIVWYAIGIVLLLGYFGYFGWSIEKSGCVKRNSNDNDNPMTNTIVITIRRTVSSSPIRSRLAALCMLHPKYPKSHNVVHLAMIEIRTHNISGGRL